MTSALDALPAHLTDSGYELLGLLPLRVAIAEAYRQRGLPTDPDQVLVTNGAQHGLALVLRALVGPGDRVLVESPTYPNALLALAQVGARPVPAPVRSTGWDLEALTAVLRQAAPTLAYVVPDFHNPTGALLAAAGRSRLVEALRATRTLAVVDETLVDLRLDGPPVPAPVAALDPSVITLGSMSKSCWGGLRIGWVRARPDVITQLVATRPGTDLGTPVLEQLAATHLLTTPDRTRTSTVDGLRDRRDRLGDLLARTLPDLRWTLPHGGLALWVELPFSSTALTHAAERHQLRLSPGIRFGTPPELDRWLRLPYTLPLDALAEAVTRLDTAARHLPAATMTPPTTSTV